MVRRTKVRKSRLPKFVPWMVLCVLLSGGILSTLVDLASLPNHVSRWANSHGQRAVIDPVTGIVSLGIPEPDQAFDVGGAASPTTAPSKAPSPETAAAAGDKLPSSLPTLREEPLKSEPVAPAARADRLVPAPAPEITETVDGIEVPRRGIGNPSAPATIYSRLYRREAKKPILAIVIMNAGLSAQSMPLLASLPKNVTIAFSPYMPDRSNLVTLRNAGYEAWGMLPVMTEHYPQDDPGPLGIVSMMPKDEILRRLHTVMSNEIGSVGVVFPPEESILNTPAFAPLFADLLSRGLYILSTHPSRSLDEFSTDKHMKAYIRRADLVLDPTPDEAQIDGRLASLSDAMGHERELIVVASARPQTLLLLQRWLKANPDAVERLAPLSAFWRKAEGEDITRPTETKPDKKAIEEKKPDDSKKPSLAGKPEGTP